MTRAPARSRAWLRWPGWPLALAAVLLLAALVLPPVDRPRSVHRYQVTFDISQSMNVADVELGGRMVTRLELAKAAWREQLGRLPCGSSVGWSVFAAQRAMTLVTPLDVCEHYDGLVAALDAIDGRMRWQNASSVGKGLHQSLRAARAIGDDVAVVLLSDGHEAPPLRAGASGIPKTDGIDVGGVLIGVGGATPVPIPRTDEEGRTFGFWTAEEVTQRPDAPGGAGGEELSSLRVEHLESLARIAGLGYATLASPSSLGGALDGNSHAAREVAVPVDFSWIPATLALAALCWRFVPRRVPVPAPISMPVRNAPARRHRGGVGRGAERGPDSRSD